MNKKNLWQVIALIAIVAALIYGLPAVINKTDDNKSQQSTQTDSSPQSQAISLTIEGLLQAKPITIAVDQTVLQVLQTLNDTDQKVRLTTKEYSGLGVLVESLGGMSNGTNAKYWQYKVNGTMPQIGADQYKLKAGDSVEWYFAKPESPSN